MFYIYNIMQLIRKLVKSQTHIGPLWKDETSQGKELWDEAENRCPAKALLRPDARGQQR